MAEYIDKQAVIDELDDKYSLGDIGRMEHDIIVNALLYAKPADVRPMVRGRWIEKYDDFIAGTCSACGWDSIRYEDDVIGMNYCPNCGAYMKGENDG